MTKEQLRIVARVRRAMADAKKAGLVTFCDAEAWAIRFVPEEEIERDGDVSGRGETVECSEDRVGAPRDVGESVSCESARGTPVRKCSVM